MENVGEESRKALGERVALFRARAGMTQTGLAEQLSEHGYAIKQSTIAKLETGKRPTPLDEVVTLARIFNVAVSDLIGITDDEGDLVNLMIEAHRAEVGVHWARVRMIEASERVAELRRELEAAEKTSRDRYGEWDRARKDVATKNAAIEAHRRKGD